MKWTIVRAIVFLIGIAGVAQTIGQTTPSATGNSVLQINFAGSTRIGESAHATTLQDVWKLAATTELKSSALDKFGRYILKKITSQTISENSKDLPLLRSLFEDLLQNRSFIEVTDLGDNSWGWTLALHADDAGLEKWKTNYNILHEHLDSGDDTPHRSINFIEIKPWVIITSQPQTAENSSDSLEINPVVQRIRRDGRPGPELTNRFLSVEVDLTKMGKRWPGLIPENLTHLTASVRGHESTLKTEVKILSSDKTERLIENWKIPVQTIRDPDNALMSFTAVRGISPWLKQHPFVSTLRLEPVPNQFFAWGNSHAPFQIQAAFPVGNGANQIELISNEFLPEWNKSLSKNAVGNLEPLTNRTGILWRSLPALTPYLRLSKEPEQDFLLAGVFPVPPSANPPPAGLISQLTSRKNLLFYNWEITQARLVQLRSLIPLVSIVTTLPNLAADSKARIWLDEVGPKLGNTVTEISTSSPDSVSILRTSHIGLNALELVAFAYWLDNPDFPEAALELGFQPVPTFEQPKP